ncbi:MAG: hypothetical protein U0230_11855 [Polyangiales bacterium]
MRTSDPGFERIEVDGQTLFLPDEVTIARLLAEGRLEGRPIASRGIFARYVATSRLCPGLRVALGEEREPDKPFIVYHVVETADGPCRVLAEAQACFHCGFRGVTANPCDYQTFVGTEDPLAGVRRARSRPSVPCPTCASPFERPAVRVWSADGAEAQTSPR